MQFSAEGQPKWFWVVALGRLTLGWWPKEGPEDTGPVTLIQSQKVKDERFYSGEELPKILICEMGMGMEAGAAAPAPGQAAQTWGRKLGPTGTQSLEREKRSQGWDWSPVRSWGRAGGPLGRGSHTVSLDSNGHQV